MARASRPRPTASFVRFAPLVLAALVSANSRAQTLDQTGRWGGPSDTLGHMSIHLALLRGDATHHSKILSFERVSGTPPLLIAKLWGWNPTTSPSDNDCSAYPAAQFQALPLDLNVPNLFCSGHSSLSTGELLIAGGTDKGNDIGHRQSIVFRPNPGPGQAQWSPQGKLVAGRWYPSNVTLPDGKVLTFSGTRFWHMVVFGGTETPQDPNSATHDDINRLGVNSAGQWLPAVTKPPSKPNWPAPREGHSAVWHPTVIQHHGAMTEAEGRQGSHGKELEPEVRVLVGLLDHAQPHVSCCSPPPLVRPPKMKMSWMLAGPGRCSGALSGWPRDLALE